MAYLSGSWETCGVLLIHVALPGYLCQRVWVPGPPSKAVGNRPFRVRVVLHLCTSTIAPSLSLAGSAVFSCNSARSWDLLGLAFAGHFCHLRAVHKMDVLQQSPPRVILWLSCICESCLRGSVVLGNAPFSISGRSEEPA